MHFLRIGTWSKRLLSFWHWCDVSSRDTSAPTDHLRCTNCLHRFTSALTTRLLPQSSLLDYGRRFIHHPFPTPTTSLRLQPLRMSVTAKLLPMCVCGGFIIAIFSRVRIETHFADMPSATGLCLFPSHSKVLLKFRACKKIKPKVSGSCKDTYCLSPTREETLELFLI
jgi:hypothetical protein